MPSTASLSIVIKARDQASRALRDVEHQTARTGGGFNKMGINIKKAAVAAGAAVVAIGALAAAAYKLGKAIVNNTAEFLRATKAQMVLARQARVSVREWGRWEVAADRAGVETNRMRNILFDLNVAMGQAVDKTGRYRDAFIELGFTIEQLQTTSSGELLYDLVDALASMEDQTRASLLATELLGEGAARNLGPLLQVGADELRRFGDHAEQVGATAGDVAVLMAHRYNEASSSIQTSLAGIQEAVSTRLAPGLVIGAEIIETFATFVATRMAAASGQTYDAWESAWRGMVQTVQNAMRAIAGILDVAAPTIVQFLNLRHTLKGGSPDGYLRHDFTFSADLERSIAEFNTMAREAGNAASFAFEFTPQGQQRQRLLQNARDLSAAGIPIGDEYLSRDSYDKFNQSTLDYTQDYFKRVADEHGVELDRDRAIINKLQRQALLGGEAGIDLAREAIGGGGGGKRKPTEPEPSRSAIDTLQALLDEHDFAGAEGVAQGVADAFKSRDFARAISQGELAVKAIVDAREFVGGDLPFDDLERAVEDVARAAKSLAPVERAASRQPTRRASTPAPRASYAPIARASGAAAGVTVQGGTVVNVYVEGYVGSENQLIRVIRGALDSGELSL